MSVMTGDVFADICRTLWGDDWKSAAAKRLKRSRRPLLNIETGKCNLSTSLRRELLTVVEEQITVLTAYESEFSG